MGAKQKFKSEFQNCHNIYYAFSDDLKSNDNTQSVWHESIVPNLNIHNCPICRCIILNKNSFDPTVCILDATHRQYKMSQILNDNDTAILTRFHMDYPKVNTHTHKTSNC